MQAAPYSGDGPNPSGLCWCGCGETTKRAGSNHSGIGYRPGQHLRYVNGHNGRKSPHRYKIEDRGYETPCWIWQRSINPSGHGRLMIGHGAQRQAVTAYRHYYEAARGPVPEGRLLHHKCEIPACVNPDHLEPVTFREHQQAHGKLTPETVAEIRAIWAHGGLRQKDIGDQFGVSQAAISKIVRNEMWVPSA